MQLLPRAKEHLDSSSGPDAVLLGKERLALLLQEVERLPPKMKGCILLRMVHQRKYREIAELLHISLDAVKVHLHEARKRLHRALEQHLDEPTN